MMLFEVGSEQTREDGRQVPERAVIEAGPALVEIVDDEVADRPAPQPVAVDQHLRADLAGTVGEADQGPRGVGRELTQFPQPEVGEPGTPGLVAPPDRFLMLLSSGCGHGGVIS